MTSPVPTEGREGQRTAVTLPDCMMPDGAEPCIAFQRLKAERDELLAALKPTFTLLQTPCGAAFRDLCPATWRQIEAAIALAEGR